MVIAKWGFVHVYDTKVSQHTDGVIGTGKYAVIYMSNQYPTLYVSDSDSMFDTLEQAKAHAEEKIRDYKGLKVKFAIIRLDAVLHAERAIINKNELKKNRYAVFYHEQKYLGGWNGTPTNHYYYLGTVEAYDTRSIKRLCASNRFIIAYKLRDGKLKSLSFNAVKKPVDEDCEGYVNHLKEDSSYEFIPLDWLLTKEEKDKKIKIEAVKNKVLKEFGIDFKNK
jgi:hypothetical protein